MEHSKEDFSKSYTHERPEPTTNAPTERIVSKDKSNIFNMEFEPVPGRVIVMFPDRIQPDKLTSDIIIRSQVIKAGFGCDGLSSGDIVIHSKEDARHIIIDNIEYLILHISDILAIKKGSNPSPPPVVPPEHDTRL